MNRVNTEGHSLIDCTMSCRAQMRKRKKIRVHNSRNKGITKRTALASLFATVIQPQDYNNKHDGSGDQNINRVVDLYFKICVVFMLLVSCLIPPFYL